MQDAEDSLWDFPLFHPISTDDCGFALSPLSDAEVKAESRPEGSRLSDLSPMSSTSSTFTEDRTTYSLSFLHTDKWKPEYQRNNRNGGLKNIRCFPFCGDKHYSSGFCGESLLLKLSIHSTDNFFSDFALNNATNNFLPEFLVICHISQLDESTQHDSDRILQKSQVISRDYLESRLRSKEKPFNEFWPCEIKTSQHDKNENLLIYECNRQKKGWNYGWTSNKYISRSQHLIRAYILKQIHTSTDQLFKVVHVEYSPAFRLFSRKPKRSSLTNHDVEIETQPEKKQKKQTSFLRKILSFEQQELSTDDSPNDSLKLFAKFLVSTDEDLTAQIQNLSVEEAIDIIKRRFNLKLDLNEELKPNEVPRPSFDMETDKSRLKATLQGFQGFWRSTAQTLSNYDAIYMSMGIPYALRKCYLVITENCEFKVKGNNQMSCLYNPKLFSTGLVKYTFDGKIRQWPLTSPLISTEFDAINYRAFVKGGRVYAEHIYRQYKMLRIYEHEEGRITGEVILYRKDFDISGTIEWNQMDVKDIELQLVSV